MSELSRQALLESLKRKYVLLRKTEQLKDGTTIPVDRYRLEYDIETIKEDIAKAEAELEKLDFPAAQVIPVGSITDAPTQPPAPQRVANTPALEPTPQELKTLRQYLVNRFSLYEISTITFDLGLDYDAFPRNTKEELCLALITRCKHDRTIVNLLKTALEARTGETIASILARLSPASGNNSAPVQATPTVTAQNTNSAEPPTVKRPLQVFLCYASQDIVAVRELYNKLVLEEGIKPWLDEEELILGQDWNVEIQKALRASDAVIICLSSISVAKEGYVQKEIKRTLDIAQEKPGSTIFAIPLKLNECKPPFELEHLHWGSLADSRGYDKLMKALRLRASNSEVIEIELQE